MSNFLTDFIKDFRARSNSPFMSAYIFSWIVINWRIVLTLFYQDDPLKYINCYLNCDIWFSIWDISIYGKAFIYPAIPSLIYITFGKWMNNQINIIQAGIDNRSAGKLNELRKKNFDSDAFDKLSKNFEALLETNKKLKNDIVELKSEVEEKDDKIEELKTDHENSQIFINMKGELEEDKKKLENKFTKLEQAIVDKEEIITNLKSKLSEYQDSDSGISDFFSEILKNEIYYNRFFHLVMLHKKKESFILKNLYLDQKLIILDLVDKSSNSDDYWFNNKGEQLIKTFAKSDIFKELFRIKYPDEPIPPEDFTDEDEDNIPF